MKASELRNKSQDDLDKELNELLKAQFSLRMQLATQQLTENFFESTEPLCEEESEETALSTPLTDRGVPLAFALLAFVPLAGLVIYQRR